MIQYGSSHLSIGVLVTLPLMILLSAGFIVIGIFIKKQEWDSFDAPLARWCKRGSYFLAGLVVLLTALGFFPYKGEYHHWQNITGTVSSTNSRFLANSSGKGTNQKFVVTFEGSDKQFGCNDTRCATIRKGDELTITCKRAWQWFGTPGYDCNFVSFKKER